MQRVPTYRPKLVEALGGEPTAAEAKVIAAAKAGEGVWLGPEGERPEGATEDNTIRAALIRFLMLGGDEDHPVHPRGVLIGGAWIAGKLDMEACETQLDLKLRACHFETAPDFDDAHLGGLYLTGCQVPGLRGHRMRLEENLNLRALERTDGDPLPFVATGPVNIAGARITGQLNCTGGRFDGAGGLALDCDAMTVGKDVFLSGGFHATGEVNLKRATVTGQLDCTGGRFDGAGGRALNCDAMTVGADVFLSGGFHATGEVNLRGATITGQLACVGGRFDGAEGWALNCDAVTVGADVFLSGGFHATGEVNLTRAIITGMLQLREAKVEGELDLTEAQVGVLKDDAVSWAQVGEVRLSGFLYGSVQSAMTLTDRMALLRRAVNGERFDPGPFTQHAQVLRRTGHRIDAARMLFLRERLLRRAEREEAWDRGGKWRGIAVLMALRDGLFQTLLGFGYRPVYALIWTAGIIGVSTLLFGHIYAVGQFAPNSDVVLNSTHWLRAVAWSDALAGWGIDIPPLHFWAGGGAIATPMPPSVDYETFGSFLYAVDLFLPLDTIGQTEAWAPSKDRGVWGGIGYWVRMPIQLMGWLITALAAALLTGLIGRKED